MQKHTFSASASPHVAYWLFACAAAVLLMVIVGGLTRLTHSGLSIVQWDVVRGILPPLYQTDWDALFTAYQGSPEFQFVHPSMTLEEFKRIFWLEYIHRLLGRFIGLLFLLPLVYFTFKRMISIQRSFALVGVFALGGLQGLLGWYMVKSGLVNVPHVSPYRLAAHLLLACILFSFLWVMALQHYRDYQRETGRIPENIPPSSQIKCCWYITLIALTLLFLQLLAGALMAGLDAGLIYNTYPFIEGKLLPSNLWWHHPWYLNFGENVAMVHFIHRNVALLLLAVIFIIATQLRRLKYHPNATAWHRHGARVGTTLWLVMLLQFSLGIATLVLHVPLSLALLHQANAILLLALLLYVAHYLHTPLSSLALQDLEPLHPVPPRYL